MVSSLLHAPFLTLTQSLEGEWCFGIVTHYHSPMYPSCTLATVVNKIATKTTKCIQKPQSVYSPVAWKSEGQSGQNDTRTRGNIKKFKNIHHLEYVYESHFLVAEENQATVQNIQYTKYNVYCTVHYVIFQRIVARANILCTSVWVHKRKFSDLQIRDNWSWLNAPPFMKTLLNISTEKLGVLHMPKILGNNFPITA